MFYINNYQLEDKGITLNNSYIFVTIAENDLPENLDVILADFTGTIRINDAEYTNLTLGAIQKTFTEENIYYVIKFERPDSVEQKLERTNRKLANINESILYNMSEYAKDKELYTQDREELNIFLDSLLTEVLPELMGMMPEDDDLSLYDDSDLLNNYYE